MSICIAAPPDAYHVVVSWLRSDAKHYRLPVVGWEHTHEEWMCVIADPGNFVHPLRLDRWIEDMGEYEEAEVISWGGGIRVGPVPREDDNA